MTLEFTSTPHLDSPCIKVCTLDAARMCTGCGRTLDEIAAWSRMNPEQRQAVCTLAADRLNAQRARAAGARL
jgi:uncharacterized protein